MENKVTMRRRLQFSTFVLISQMLLIALAISWVIHMAIIAVDGSAYFVENNHLILWSEIIATLLITIFAIFILATQLQRLGERRSGDRNPGNRRK